LLSACRSRPLVIAISLIETVSLIVESLEPIAAILRFIGTGMLKFAVVWKEKTQDWSKQKIEE
jgi:hypothetical protein